MAAHRSRPASHHMGRRKRIFHRKARAAIFIAIGRLVPSWLTLRRLMDSVMYDDVRAIRFLGRRGYADYVVEARRATPVGWHFTLQFSNDNKLVHVGMFTTWSEGIEAAVLAAKDGVARFDQPPVVLDP